MIRGPWRARVLRRYPCVRQQDESDCGPAVLGTVALYHGLRTSIAKIREVSGTDLRGTSLLGLSAAARGLGFEAKGVRARWEDLGGLELPAIAHVINDHGAGHFVVLYEVTSTQVTLADPGVGITTWSKAKFIERWSTHFLAEEERSATFGALLLLIPTPRLQQPNAMGKGSKWLRLWPTLAPHTAIVLEIVLCAVLATALAIGGSLFIQVLVDSLLTHSEVHALDGIALGMVLLHVFRISFGALRQYLLVYLAQRIDMQLILQYYGHLLMLPLRFFRSRQVGEILSRMNDVERIRTLVQGAALAMVADTLVFLCAGGVMLCYEATLAFMVLGSLAFFALFVVAVNKPMAVTQRKAMEQAAELEAQLVESVSGMATIKQFGVEAGALHKTRDKLTRAFGTSSRSAMFGIFAGTAGALYSSLVGLFVLWYGGHRVMTGELSLGQLMFFNSLLGYLLVPVERISEVIVALQGASIAIDRLGEILDLEPEQQSEDKKVVSKSVSGELKVENLSFAYGHREPVLSGITLTVPAGTTLALVGESGCGKTTLSALLARLDDPSAGRILLDGVDLRDWSSRVLREAIGIVPQEPFLFRGRIRENIALSKPEASLEEIIEAAKKAQIHGFISSLPDRYETLIGERGMDLSGGQRQRLAIARALLRQPRVLVLDEATSSLDAETEQAVKAALSQATGRTTVLISHRLSTVTHADRIAVLHEGEIEEQGTHEDLMRRRGRYYSLWQRQLPTAKEGLAIRRVETAPEVCVRESLSLVGGQDDR